MLNNQVAAGEVKRHLDAEIQVDEIQVRVCIGGAALEHEWEPNRLPSRSTLESRRTRVWLEAKRDRGTWTLHQQHYDFFFSLSITMACTTSSSLNHQSIFPSW